MKTPKDIAKDIISWAEKRYADNADKYLQYEFNGLKQEIAKLDISFDETTLVLDKDLFCIMYEEKVERVRWFNIEYVEWILELNNYDNPVMTKSKYKKIKSNDNLKRLMIELFDWKIKEVYHPYYIVSGTCTRIPLQTA